MAPGALWETLERRRPAGVSRLEVLALELAWYRLAEISSPKDAGELAFEALAKSSSSPPAARWWNAIAAAFLSLASTTDTEARDAWSRAQRFGTVLEVQA